MAATISLVDVVTNGTKRGRDGHPRQRGTAMFRVQADGKIFDYKYVFADAASIHQAAVAAQACQTAR